MNEGGFISIKALTLIIFLTVAITGLMVFVRTSFTYEQKSVAQADRRAEMRSMAQKVVRALLETETAEADSAGDEVWSELKQIGKEDYTVELKDISSYLNPNGVRKTLLERTGLHSLLAPEYSPDALQQYREENGLMGNIEISFKDYFTEEAFSNPFLTGYSYFNINVTDEFVLRKLCEIRTGDPLKAELFHTKIQEALKEKRIIKKNVLDDFLGTDFIDLFPVVNAEPLFNVHFAPGYLMEEILSYPVFEIDNPQAVLTEILSNRESGELTEEDLHRIITKEPDNRIYQYLGTITWFWQITVTENDSGRSYALVVARLPDPGDGGYPVYTTIEERYGG